MQDVLLIIPPYRLYKGRAVRPEKAMLPTGPVVIATLLKEKGCRVRTINLVFKERWWKKLRGISKPDILLLPCHTLNVIDSCIVVSKFFRRQWGQMPYTVSHCGEVMQKQLSRLGFSVDAVAVGYAHGQDVIEQIMNHVNGDLCSHESFGSLPTPNFSDMDRFTANHYLRASGKIYPLVGSGLGCTYSCTYCGIPGKQQWTPRNWDTLGQELHEAIRLGYREIWDVSNLQFVRWQDRETWERLLRFDKRVRNLGLRWRGMTRLELVPPVEYLRQLKGLTNVAIALETVNEFEWQLWNRGGAGTYLQNFRRAVCRLREAGITCTVFVMIDTPGATTVNTWQMFRFLEECGVDEVSASYYGESEMFITGQWPTSEFGFYIRPYGNSTLAFAQAVGFMMVFNARWQLGWHPLPDPFFETTNYKNMKGKVLGANFLEGAIFQRTKARAKTGDGYKVWRMERRTGYAEDA